MAARKEDDLVRSKASSGSRKAELSEEIDQKEFMKKVKITIEKERDFLERIGRL